MVFTLNKPYPYGLPIYPKPEFLRLLSIQLSAISLGLWLRYANGQKLTADRRRA
ncbi:MULTISPECIES: hypothetical protein [unclassified Moorena]|uniref:hypothetical protein n=1 Tax=unclassified Moorena TaxID=2683338 RepID=UPI0003043BB1|nr:MULTISPECIES: hypothetical protein [unclassified Moorena]NEQ09463.1 hypothetical protein [Moorena sp. SIO4E2]NEQ15166.1 hypothetical protein [Moorena sp. SIO3E2]NES41617.1 hypothetical protein [Moorena sp. SIO2C4]